MFCSVALHRFGECTSSSFKPLCLSLCLPSLCILTWFWFTSCRHCAPMLSALSPLCFFAFFCVIFGACSDRDLCVYGHQDQDEHMTFRSCKTGTTHVSFLFVCFFTGEPLDLPHKDLSGSPDPHVGTGTLALPARPTVSVKKKINHCKHLMEILCFYATV